MHIYSQDEVDFIKSVAKGRTTYEITEMINYKFGIELSRNQVRAYMKNHGIKNGLDCSFKKSNVPFNKGIKKYWKGGEETQFKKGNRPHNYLPVGTERINGDDYVDIKIADPNKWKGKHILLWKEHHGEIPKGHCIIFADGDNRNFDLSNLICVSRAQLVVMNTNKLIKNDVELTQVGVSIADIKLKIGAIKRKDKRI